MYLLDFKCRQDLALIILDNCQNGLFQTRYISKRLKNASTSPGLPYPCFYDKRGGGVNKATVCPCFCDKNGTLRQKYFLVVVVFFVLFFCCCCFSKKEGNNTIECPRFCKKGG